MATYGWTNSKPVAPQNPSFTPYTLGWSNIQRVDVNRRIASPWGFPEFDILIHYEDGAKSERRILTNELRVLEMFMRHKETQEQSTLNQAPTYEPSGGNRKFAFGR